MIFMSRLFKFIVLFFFIGFFSSVVFAHPGHGDYLEEVSSQDIKSSGSSSGVSKVSTSDNNHDSSSSSKDSSSGNSYNKNEKINNGSSEDLNDSDSDLNGSKTVGDSDSFNISLNMILILIILFIVVFGSIVVLFKLGILK